MTISCKMQQCPYNDNRGFCAKPTVMGIDQMGMCSVIWRKGQRRMFPTPFTDEKYSKDPIIILESIEKEEKEDAGSRQEDPLNEVAALNDGNN